MGLFTFGLKRLILTLDEANHDLHINSKIDKGEYIKNINLFNKIFKQEILITPFQMESALRLAKRDVNSARLRLCISILELNFN